jgi:dienelactone hydrolase
MKPQRIFWLIVICAVIGIISPTLVMADAVVQKKTINEDGIVADFFFCNEAKNLRPLIMLGGAEGGKVLSEWTEKINTLVHQGYAVLVLAYFGMEGLPPTLQSVPLKYFDKAVDWVRKQPLVDPNGVGVIAGSKGTEAGLLLATTNHNVKAVVAIAPSAYVFWGIYGPGGKEQRTSSWSRGGKDISFAPMVSSKEVVIKAMQTGKFLEIYSEAIANPKATEAEIRIEQAKAPILFISGKKDELWPSYKMAESMMKRLKENEYAYHYEHLNYNTNHDVIQEAPESWEKILSFLKTYYASSSEPFQNVGGSGKSLKNDKH